MPWKDLKKKKEYDRLYRKNNRGRINKYQKRYYRLHPEKLKKKERNRTQALRSEILLAYGGLCVCCGETEPLFLTVDHIKRDGAKHRRKLTGTRTGSTSTFLRWLKRNGYPKKDFRLLCYNCNCGRERNKGICPHEANQRA